MAEAMVTEPSVRNPPTFESVWVTLQELAVSQKETDRLKIEYSGENFYITTPNGQPKEW